jgi:Domain of unknown function (DUF4189)
MPTARTIAKPIAVALASILIADALLDCASATETGERPFLIAQSSLGGPEQLPPSVAPTPPSYPPPSSAPSSSSPRVDFVPPGLRPNQQPPSGIVPPSTSPRTDYVPPGQDPNQPSANPGDMYWGAIAFTADGSYSSAWKMPSQPEAEARVLKQCASYGRGSCEVTSFSGQECVGLATFIGNYRRRRWLLSFTAGGMTYPDAQRSALDRCNADERSQGRCQTRTTACADGR